MSFDFIQIDDILTIHKDQIDRFDVAKVARDPSLLQATLFRPQLDYYPTLIDEAAAL